MSETEQEQEQTTPQEPAETPESDDELETEEETQKESETQENGSQAAAGAMSEKEMEKAFKLLDREATRHRNRLSEIMGEDAQTLEPCPCCEPSMAGFMFPVTVAPLTEEKQGALLALLGKTIEDELVQDPDYTTCDHCGGWGDTLSGAKKPTTRIKLCDKCGGNGFVQKPIEQRIPALFKVEPNAGNATFPAAMPPPQNADEWGRPPGHAHYGIPPAYVMAQMDRPSWSEIALGVIAGCLVWALVHGWGQMTRGDEWATDLAAVDRARPFTLAEIDPIHRLVSRIAQRERMKDPVYEQNWHMGMMARDTKAQPSG